MDISGKEAELKVELGPEDLALLRKHPVLRTLATGPATTRSLRSIYFDTAGQALHAHRISLRVRRVDGAWIQTVKQGVGLSGGLSTPRECEVPVDGPEPALDAIADETMRAGVLALVKSAPLVPLFETRMRRTQRDLKTPDGDLVELAFDVGEIVAGEASRPLCEVELELKDGALSALFEVARSLFSDVTIRFSKLSKAQRGYALAAGLPDAPLAPSAGALPALKPKMGAERALRATLRACAEQIADNRAVILASDDPEGAHQLRVGLRRLRSALKTFHPLIESPATEHLDAQARHFAGIAGRLRDLDVLLADILAPVRDRTPDRDGLKMLELMLEDHRKAARAEVRAALSGGAFNGFLLDLGAYTETRSWRARTGAVQSVGLAQQLSAARKEPVRDFAARALDARWAHAEKRARHLESLTIEERHALRRSLKKLRYATEFFAALYPAKPTQRFLKQLKKLQDLFGYLNDVAMAERLPAMLPDPAPTPMTLAAGHTIGWHQAHADHAWEDVQKRWEKLCGTERFW
ncbi:CYTH and CHAD domain-containing protein [Breoghania sp. L-A4]|uniref:CYTH and CHAD domain-containing protein n=1 Tax=Breoghania sp. L-A4 TaxID=2304600 RepID=UPI000E35D86B|nr:CYTH and CHAD domain-containing protein [Breoghania sp. L-A4]AXS39357.1 CHAD domain-containing protein [Breoghania sp. L-A4]